MARPTVSVDFDKIRNPTEIMTNNTYNDIFLIFFFEMSSGCPESTLSNHTFLVLL